MSKLTNPFEIAREALKRMATRRIAPTPDNYLALYQEISATDIELDVFPEKHLRSLATALPRATPDQLRLARKLDDAVKKGDWEHYQTALTHFIKTLIDAQKQGWADLISDLIKQWDARHIGLTTARKRESLEHVLSSSASNNEILFGRLQNLLRSWGQGQEQEFGAASVISSFAEIGAHADDHVLTESPTDELLPEFRELFAFTLENVVSTQLVENPKLSKDAKALAHNIRTIKNIKQMQHLLTRLKRFAFKLELMAEDQAELRNSLLSLLRLLVENMTELVMEDRWLHGQINIVHDIIEKPLSQRGIDDAQRRLKEVLYKQSHLKTSLLEAKEAIKHMLSGFVDHLSQFTDATSEYGTKIESCAQKISAAQDINELEDVLSEVIQETRLIRINAERSWDEMRQTQEKVKASEARIFELERQLEAASDLIRHDHLTGLLNRRGLDEVFSKEIARSKRHETSLCVSVLDIDNFKRLNDTLGHTVGDQAIIYLAQTCRESLRPQDTIARFGGEEFVIILPDTTLDEAVLALTRLQRELTKKFFLTDNEKILITFSAGVTRMQPEEDQATVIHRADAAMYEAKQAGKNRVIAV